MLFAASFLGNSTWGQKCHEALLGVEIEYVEHLLRDIQQRDVPGALAEFGVFQGWWVNHLFEVSEHLGLDRPVLGFDSFRGLSEPDPERDDPFWKEGQYAASIEAVGGNVKARERARIRLIPVFFADSPTAGSESVEPSLTRGSIAISMSRRCSASGISLRACRMARSWCSTIGRTAWKSARLVPLLSGCRPCLSFTPISCFSARGVTSIRGSGTGPGKVADRREGATPLSVDLAIDLL